ncbi:MAG: PAS domain-containing protein [Rhizobiaceae bacterium]|nr:PAS domain-containing protein [Rhizobiaceae bacterium]
MAIIPLTALVSLLLWHDHDQTSNRARASVRDAAFLAASNQSSVFVEAKATLATLSLTPATRKPQSFAACSAIVSAVKSAHPLFNTIGVLGADGMITCHSSLKASQRFGDAELLARAQATKAPEFLVGRFAIGRASGKPTIATLLTLHDENGAFAGAILVSLSLERLSAAAEGISDGGKRVIVMIEPSSGRMLTRYPPLPIPYGSAFPDHPLSRAMQAQPAGGTVEAFGIDNVERVYGFAPLTGAERSGIMLAVGELKEPLMAPVRQRALLSLSFLLAVLLVASIAIWWLGYWTQLRPIARLMKTAEKIGAGDHTARATLEAWQAPEFRRFGRSLDELALKLAEGRRAEQAIAESNRYLTIAERLAHVGYWQLDLATMRSTWSDGVFRIYGLPVTSEVPSADDIIETYHRDERAIIETAFERAIEDGAEFEINLRLTLLSGEIRHVLSRGCVDKSGDGKVVLVYGALLDITEVKRAELAAQGANTMLLMAEEVSEVGHWRLDLLFGSLTWSEQVYRMHGRDAQTFVPLLDSAIEAYHPDDRADVQRIVEGAIEDRRPFEFQKRILRADGAVRDVISRGRCEIDFVSGEVTAIFGVIMDVTAQRTVERQLQAKSALLAMTLDTMDQGLIMIGTDGGLDVSNRRFAELLDLPAHVLKEARPDFDDILAYLSARGEYGASDEHFQRHVGTRGAPFTLGVYERRRPNGRILEVRTAALPNESGIVRTYTDVTEKRQAEDLLRESEVRYRMLADNATDMIFRLDRNLVRTYVSPASQEILGYAPEELVGKRPANMVHPDDAEELARVYWQVLGGLERADITNRIRHRDGHWVWVEVELRALRDPASEEVVGILGALRDVSDRKAAEELVAASEARFRMLSENTADLVTHVDASGRRVFASPASLDLLGYLPEELIGGRPIDLAHPEDAPGLDVMLTELRAGRSSDAVQYRARRKSGAYLWIEASGRPLGPDKGYILGLRDVDRRKQVEDELEKAVLRLNALANSDGLTGLANRRRFDETLEKELARAARTGSSVSLLLADVDNFKAYNDTYGHPAGDACLRTVAEVLANVFRRPGDVAARYGGEEFAAILPDTDKEGALAVAEMFRTRVAASAMEHRKSGYGVVTVSIGVVAIVPTPGVTSPGDVLEAADSALYAAKGSGRNTVRSFESLEPELRHAG